MSARPGLVLRKEKGVNIRQRIRHVGSSDKCKKLGGPKCMSESPRKLAIGKTWPQRPSTKQHLKKMNATLKNKVPWQLPTNGC